MHVGKLVFAHVMEFTPWRMFRRRVARYGGDFNVSSFGCMDQFSAWPLLNRPIARVCATSRPASAQPAKLYHLGIWDNVTRSNLGDANETRDWHV